MSSSYWETEEAPPSQKIRVYVVYKGSIMEIKIGNRQRIKEFIEVACSTISNYYGYYGQLNPEHADLAKRDTSDPAYHFWKPILYNSDPVYRWLKDGDTVRMHTF